VDLGAGWYPAATAAQAAQAKVTQGTNAGPAEEAEREAKRPRAELKKMEDTE
jgi:hypothetical protein